MFNEFLRSCPPEDEIKPSKKRIGKNIAAVRSLIETEESNMTKRRFKAKPLIIAAAVIIFSAASLFTVNAAMQGAVVRFFMGGEEIEGEYYDYVDGDGYRRVSFGAVMPLYEQNFAVIYDVDAPQGENVRVITDATDPEFMDKLRSFKEAQDEFWEARKEWRDSQGLTKEDILNSDSEYNTNPEFYKEFTLVYPEPEDFGLVFKDSELCTYKLGYLSKDDFSLRDGTLGGEFMYAGAAGGKPSGFGGGEGDGHFDWENETQAYGWTFYYYVGKE